MGISKRGNLKKERNYEKPNKIRKSGGGNCLKFILGVFALSPKQAFTLAEVLITLGIIGVVAAMTIPTLMANIKARQYTSRFKKAVSTLSNAGRMSQELYGFDYEGINKLCNENSGSDHPDTTQSVCALLNGTLKGAHFYYGMDKLNYNMTSKFVDFTWSFNSFKNKLPIYLLPDGQLLILSSKMGNMGCGNRNPIYINDAGEENGTACYALIDVNGVSLPNKEVTCSKGTNRYYVMNSGDCVVNFKSIGDIFPVVFYKDTVEPFSSAGWYIYRNAKN